MIKKILIAIALALTAIGIYLAWGILSSIAVFLSQHLFVLLAVACAVLVQLIGHILRAQRTKLVIDQAASSSLKFQFGALSVGYLFNALLPFRLGELIRALLVARRLHISLLYTFMAVVIERATDVIFLSVLVIVGLIVMKGYATGGLFVIAVVSGLLAAGLIYLLVLLKNENARLLRLAGRFSDLFNTTTSNRLRFKIWSLIFGLQNFFNNRRLVRQYVLYAAVSWLCYFASALVIILAVLSLVGPVQLAVASVSPYVVSVNPLDATSYAQLVTTLPVELGRQNLDIYARIIWAVLVLPMALVGLVALVLYRPGTKQTADDVQIDPYVNKLMRHKDISQDFPAFLESYFSGNMLAKILHKIEVSGELSLVRYFKGGSDAITVLVLADGKLFVKKIIPLEYRDRLKAQYDWLQEHKKMKYLVEVIGEQDTDDYYAIDLAYDPKNVPFFEYIHHSSLAESKIVIDKVWQALYDHLHKDAKELAYQPKHRDKYIEKHIIGCVDKAVDAHEGIRKAVRLEKITINGEIYDNLYQILDKIKKNKQAWRDIATYQESGAVHGDPSIDNFLVSSKTGRPLIIDPAPDGNIINGPVFDMGKFMQSFYCGYEFLFRDEDLVELGAKGTINYRDHKSEKYTRICRYVQTELAPKYLSEAEQRAIVFHGATLLLRRLKHQVQSNPDNALKMYAVGVKTLNDFLGQYV